MSEAMKPCPVADELFAAIEHGDAEHRAWLRAKLDEFFVAWNTRHTESPLGPVADELERMALRDELRTDGPDFDMSDTLRGRAFAYREAAALVRQSSPATAREVEELRAENERLREALGKIDAGEYDDFAGDPRRWATTMARAALASKGEAA